jgi:hypothetical protein
LRGWGVFYSELVIPAPAFAGTGYGGNPANILLKKLDARQRGHDGKNSLTAHII